MLVVTFDNTNGRFVLVKTMKTINYNHIASNTYYVVIPAHATFSVSMHESDKHHKTGIPDIITLMTLKK